MTDLREAAQQALEALEYEAKRGNDNAYEAERKALKRALAEDAMDKMAENARELGLDYEPDLATVGEVGVWGEPVAMRWDFDGYGYRYIDSGSGSNWQTRVKDAEPLYDRPQQCPNCASLMEQNTELDKKLAEWVGLTEEEIEKCKFDSLNGTGWSLNVDINLFYKSVEAKLKEKNR